MPIGWYPGHMHKASKELRALLKKLHLVVEVLDARAPAASSNPVLSGMAPELPRIRILNKADLADPESVRAWQQSLHEPGRSHCLINGRDAVLGSAELLSSADGLLRGRPGVPASNRLMSIVGIPNVGKSTLINQFAGRKLAKTGNEPAITRGQQRIRLSEEWLLIDTPGLLAPKLNDQHAAYLLAMLGCIRNTALDSEDVAWFAAEQLMRLKPEALSSRYGAIGPGETGEAVLSAVAKSQGALAGGGQVDWYRASELLLNDFRSGKLGRVSLEQVPA